MGPLLLTAILLGARPTLGADFAGSTAEPDVWQDLLDTGSLAGRAFVRQVTRPVPLGVIAGSTLIVAGMATSDSAWSREVERARVLGGAARVGDIGGLVLNFAVVPVGAYSIGRLIGEPSLLAFARDNAATLLIALPEVAVLSNLPSHERPVIERGERAAADGDAIDDLLRGRYSFPSGHMVGVGAFAWQSWLHYGWKAGVPATALAGFVGWSRVEEGEHYLTDVVAGFLITGVAALAVHDARTDSGADLTVFGLRGGVGISLTLTSP